MSKKTVQKSAKPSTKPVDPPKFRLSIKSYLKQIVLYSAIYVVAILALSGFVASAFQSTAFVVFQNWAFWTLPFAFIFNTCVLIIAQFISYKLSLKTGRESLVYAGLPALGFLFWTLFVIEPTMLRGIDDWQIKLSFALLSFVLSAFVSTIAYLVYTSYVLPRVAYIVIGVILLVLTAYFAGTAVGALNVVRDVNSPVDSSTDSGDGVSVEPGTEYNYVQNFSG